MKTIKEPNFLMKIFFILSLCLFFAACASKPEKNFTYAPTANAVDELHNLKSEMNRTESEQIAFFAPNSFDQANKHWDKAQKLQEKGSSNGEVLEELGLARSYFEQARGVADRSLQAMPDVAEAREKALMAGAARFHRADLVKADKDLMDVTKGFEKKNPDVSLKERTELLSAYNALELRSIKTSRLGDTAANIEGAKKMGAGRYAPRTLSSAEGKLRSAEMTINTDRHNDALVSAAQDDAFRESQKLLKVTEISKRSGQTGNEALALDIFNRDQQIESLNTRVSSTESQLTEAQRAAQAAQLSAARATSELEGRRLITSIQSQFSPKEAEVLQQGDNLIIRLKALNFASGRSEVPSAAYPVLNKVKNTIQQLNAKKVTVEGHTDSTGAATLNQKISQQRADSVVRFLEDSRVNLMTGSSTQTAVEGQNKMMGATESSETQFEARGYGYEHPVATNKTKEGRAQNRRVDVVIATGMAPDTAE